MARVNLNVDLNRVEGDLEIGLTLEEGVVVEARVKGTMYRGFEQLLLGRAPQDALVLTPRICGICSTAHLNAAVLALEDLWRMPVPAQATRIRNLCLIAEGIQNDLRQTFLFFAPDFCHPRYAAEPWFDALVAAFEPFRGGVYRETLAITRRAVEIIAHFGGQWPHSSYMTPGGVTSPADLRRLIACRAALDEIQRWYEQRVIGVSLDDWLALDEAEDYFALLESKAHGESALGILGRAARALQLHRAAVGARLMLSFGAWIEPQAPGERLLPAGVYDADADTTAPLDQMLINEHVRHSWFRPYEGGRHPWRGETVPLYQPGGDRYSWAKAPRYGDRTAQTGPLAELLIGGDKLIASLFRTEGGGAWLRQFARVRRIGHEFVAARRMLDELAQDLGEPHIAAPRQDLADEGEGSGLIMAARGALGHWLKLKGGRIDKYQIITPTAWNASPRDSDGRPGHWEQSLVGVAVADPDDPIEIGHIIRSHDPCLVCTVHMLASGQRIRMGA